jgi:large subunit ribosomal protein L24
MTKIKKNDQVKIISGKDKGKTGKVLRVFPVEGKIIVEGLNLRKKHLRPRREGEKGQRIEIPGKLNASNVMLICPKCGKETRIGQKLTEKNKLRICKKCQAEI